MTYRRVETKENVGMVRYTFLQQKEEYELDSDDDVVEEDDDDDDADDVDTLEAVDEPGDLAIVAKFSAVGSWGCLALMFSGV